MDSTYVRAETWLRAVLVDTKQIDSVIARTIPPWYGPLLTAMVDPEQRVVALQLVELNAMAIGPVAQARWAMRLGAPSRALDYLEEAYSRVSVSNAGTTTYWVAWDVQWAALRGEPRFRAILGRLGLGP